MELLVVDDDLEVQRIVLRALDQEGIHTSTAATGAEALDHAIRFAVDVAILDLHLPDMTGLELLEDLRSIHPAVYVIMLTGAGSEADRVLGLVSGADDYMVKPFSPRELAARVLSVSRRFAEPHPAQPIADPSAPSALYRLSPAPEPARRLGSRASHASDATVVITGTTIRFASEAMVTLLAGSSVGDVVGHDVFEFIAARSIGATSSRFEQVRAGKLPRPELLTVTRIDHVEVLVEIASAPVLWNGEPASQVTVWDLAGDTGPLRELATGFSSDVPDAVIVTTEDLRIQSFNEAAEALYGWSEAEVVGRSLTDVIGWELAGDDPEAARTLLLASGRWHGEELQRARDGTGLLVRSSKTVLRDASGGTVGIITVNRPREREAGAWADSRVNPDLGLDSAIRVGIPRGEFVVHYQPVVALGTGEILGVEALVRWQHPERGLLPPSEFIAVAERSGVIVDLGRVVLEEACRQAQAWHEAGHHLYMAVNLSARQLADPTLSDWIAEVMQSTAMPPQGLWLEVTETALVQDLDQATAALHRLDGLGACVSIDDFGTGWASLTYLREFPVHALKIDRVFVAGLGAGSRDETIVGSMLSLGRELDVVVIAEGVETEEQQAILLDLGCEVGQGYLFGRPQPAGAIDSALAAARTSNGRR